MLYIHVYVQPVYLNSLFVNLKHYVKIFSLNFGYDKVKDMGKNICLY